MGAWAKDRKDEIKGRRDVGKGLERARGGVGEGEKNPGRGDAMTRRKSQLSDLGKNGALCGVRKN